MKDFVDARQGTVQGDVRIDVPVLLPGYAVFGKFKGDPADNFAIVATIYSIPSQLFRVPMRTINRFLKPKQRVYDRAKLQNFEIVMTESEIHYSPLSPLLLKTYEPVFSEPIAGTAINFHTVEDGMSQLAIGADIWNVAPEYAGDVRWALRRIANENPDYKISFGGADLPDSATKAANKAAAEAKAAAAKAEAAAAAAATAAAVAAGESNDDETQDDLAEDDDLSTAQNEEE